MGSQFQTSMGRAIAAERKFLGITQIELGRRLSWSDSTISDIERGERPVSLTDLPEICLALECPVLRLLRRAGVRDLEAMQLEA